MNLKNALLSEKNFYLIEALKFISYNVLLLVFIFTLSLSFRAENYNNELIDYNNFSLKQIFNDDKVKLENNALVNIDNPSECPDCSQKEKNDITSQERTVLNPNLEHQNEKKEDAKRDYENDNTPIENSKEFKYENGDVYRGDHNKGIRNGYGVLKKNNKLIYEGNWKDNVFLNGYMYQDNFAGNGFAKSLYENGDTCEGFFLNYKREGKQKCNFYDGSRYAGNYKADEKNGYGIMDFTDSRHYEGYWLNNEFSGQGRLEFANGEWQEGEWKNNKMDGDGTYQYNNGAKFIGSWKKGLKEGDGELRLTDISTKFLGSWSSGHGQGTYYMKYNKTCLATEFNGNITCIKEESKPEDSKPPDSHLYQ